MAPSGRVAPRARTASPHCSAVPRRPRFQIAPAGTSIGIQRSARPGPPTSKRFMPAGTTTALMPQASRGTVALTSWAPNGSDRDGDDPRRANGDRGRARTRRGRQNSRHRRSRRHTRGPGDRRGDLGAPRLDDRQPDEADHRGQNDQCRDERPVAGHRRTIDGECRWIRFRIYVIRAARRLRRDQLAAGTTRPSGSSVAWRRRSARSSAPGTWSRAW